MRGDAVWNENGYYEAPEQVKVNNIKIDITKCELIMNALGFIYLMLDGKELKSLTAEEYIKYRNYVKKDHVWECVNPWKN